MHTIHNYKDFVAKDSLIKELRGLARKAIIGGLSLTKNISNQTDWIRFPYYHHIFDDEKLHFERQLKYLKNIGEFISMDDACNLIKDDRPIRGRYFSVSFDDGFFNCFSNMMDITVELDIPVIIYLPVNFIGLDADKAEDQEKIASFYAESLGLVPFLNWEQCKIMLKNKISFGSHTCSHANLAKISDGEIENELRLSKKIIEENLSVECNHFACPWGRPGMDFYPEKTSAIAKKTGYTSFATTARGKMINKDDLFLLKRDHLLAHWENYQLRYFFSL